MPIIIFYHRRDLRIEDNIAMYKSIQYLQDNNSSRNIIIPVFIFDPKQIVLTENNKYYYSKKAAYFIIQSVIDLQNQYKELNSNLLILYSNPIDGIKTIIEKIKSNYIDEIIVSFNLDYSKYSEYRDSQILKIKNILFINDDDHSDYCLYVNSAPYKQFGAYYKQSIKNKPTLPYKISLNNLLITHIKFNKLFNDIKFTKINNLITSLNIDNLWINAGRDNCINSIINSRSRLKKYNDNKDILSYETSKLSAYLNIGTISIRELYYYFSQNLHKNNNIIKQLYWRDFYLLALRFIDGGNEYKHMDDRYNNLKWHNSLVKTSSKYKAMKLYWEHMMDAKTGFLLIDACMTELKETGFLHGRGRILLGVFWIKYLLIDPFDLEYGLQSGFSKLLIDAIGPSQNKLNVQWLTEFDYAGRRYAPKGVAIAGRPIRIDNLQIKKYDKNGIYIKKWLPHLNILSNKELYTWNGKENIIHPKPIFNHITKYNEWIELCGQ